MILKDCAFCIATRNCTPDFHDVLTDKYLQETGSSARRMSSKTREHTTAARPEEVLGLVKPSGQQQAPRSQK